VLRFSIARLKSPRIISHVDRQVAMRNVSLSPNETFEQWRQRMLDETRYFIEWGLAHPEEVQTIPFQPVGHAAFSDRFKTLFWALILRDD